jgi:hypothetical protein
MGGQGDLRPISLEWSGIPLRDRAALFGSLRSSWQRKTRHSLAGLDGLEKTDPGGVPGRGRSGGLPLRIHFGHKSPAG